MKTVQIIQADWFGPRGRAVIFLAAAGLLLALWGCENAGTGPASGPTQAALETAIAGNRQTVAAFSALQAAPPAAPAPSSLPQTENLPTPSPGTPGQAALVLPQTAQAPPPAASFLLPSTDEARQAAKILLYENISGRGYVRLVKKSLDQAGYVYTDVGSAKGWFKNLLLSSQDWDLVILADEARTRMGGEFYTFVKERLDRGSAAIIETWNLDEAASGFAAPMLRQCGLELQNDWFEPQERSVWWLAPRHPLLRVPNEIGPSLRLNKTLWSGDLGDLLQVNPGAPGDAQLIAGVSVVDPTSHGVLATCLDGRLVLQTFSTHEYDATEMTALWQNYVYQALNSRFAASPPAPLYQPPANAPLPPVEAATSEPAPCGGVLTFTVPRPPELAPALFEHHPQGLFLTLEVQAFNHASLPVQLWAGDYSLEEAVNGEIHSLLPHKDATGYLFNRYPIQWYQDRLPPGTPWKTMLAFDVSKRGRERVLLLRPGATTGRQVCELRISLE